MNNFFVFLLIVLWFIITLCLVITVVPAMVLWVVDENNHDWFKMFDKLVDKLK